MEDGCVNKEEFIGKLEMVYVGDKRASEEIISEYDRLNNIINELEKWCNECIDNHIIARENGYTTISDTFFEIVLDKIKTLKENNK